MPSPKPAETRKRRGAIYHGSVAHRVEPSVSKPAFSSHVARYVARPLGTTTAFSPHSISYAIRRQPPKNVIKGGYRATKRDKKYLKLLKQGKSIGFTMRSSLKAKGLIPRANGTRRVSKKYL